MGLVVSQLADIAIITSDDTRDENIQNINQQIISGIKPESVLIDTADLSEIKKLLDLIKINLFILIFLIDKMLSI